MPSKQKMVLFFSAQKAFVPSLCRRRITSALIQSSSIPKSGHEPVYATTQIPYDIALTSDGSLYLSILATSGSGSLQHYTASSNSWQDVSPASGRNAYTVSVDPFNEQRLFVGDGGVSNGNLWRTTDGGAHWDTLNLTLASADIPWILNTDEAGYMSSGKFLFDPHTQNQLWFAQGTGVWRANNLSDTTITWNFVSKGIEEMVSNDVIAPPGGKPVTAVDDRNGFYHANPDAYPQSPILTSKFSAGLSLDYSGGTPSFIAALSSDTRNINPDQSGYSTDGGQTWTQFSGSRNYADLYGGNIAVSATDTTNIVWLPTNNKKPYYTTDRGATWTQGATGLDSASDLHRLVWWGHKKALDADKVTGGLFYLYSASNGGSFYRSSDGGKTWTQGASTAPSSTGNDSHVFGQVRAVPGYAGNVWVSTVQGGL